MAGVSLNAQVECQLGPHKVHGSGHAAPESHSPIVLLLGAAAVDIALPGEHIALEVGLTLPHGRSLCSNAGPSYLAIRLQPVLSSRAIGAGILAIPSLPPCLQRVQYMLHSGKC